MKSVVKHDFIGKTDNNWQAFAFEPSGKLAINGVFVY
jgi:hypothetical protein